MKLKVWEFKYSARRTDKWKFIIANFFLCKILNNNKIFPCADHLIFFSLRPFPECDLLPSSNMTRMVPCWCLSCRRILVYFCLVILASSLRFLISMNSSGTHVPVLPVVSFASCKQLVPITEWEGLVSVHLGSQLVVVSFHKLLGRMSESVSHVTAGALVYGDCRWY